MAEQRVLYKCRICLRCSEGPEVCHGHEMVRCMAGEPGSEASRPVQSAEGQLLSHAPKWWVLTVLDLERRALQARRQV